MLVNCNFHGWSEVLIILLKLLSIIWTEISMHISLNTVKMMGVR